MNSKVKYFWNFFVFFVLLFYFNKLNEKSKTIINATYYEKITNNHSILFCVPLKIDCNQKFNKTGNFLNSSYKNETMKDLVCHLNKNILKNPKYIIEEAEKWNFFDAFNSECNNTVKKEIILFDYQLCANFDLIFNLSKKFNEFNFALNNINVKTYFYPANKINLFFGINILTFNFTEDSSYVSSLLIKAIELQNLDYNKLCFSEKDKNNSPKCSKLVCIKSCYKNKINSSKFLYTKNDNLLVQKNNKKINSIDEKCLSECFKDFYGYYYYLKNIKYKDEKTKNVKIFFDSSKTKIVSNNPSKKFIFLEACGLISILFGFNYLSFFLNCWSKLIKLLKIKKEILIKKIEIFILIFVTANLLIESSKMINTYTSFFSLTTSTSFYPIVPKPFSISFCFDVKKITIKKNNKIFINTKKNLKNTKILFLEKYTLKFKKIFKKSFVKFMNYHKRVNFFKKEEKVFYISKWTFNNSRLNIFKCFTINVNVTLSLIENLIGCLYIKFEFRKPVSFFFDQFSHLSK